MISPEIFWEMGNNSSIKENLEKYRTNSKLIFLPANKTFSTLEELIPEMKTMKNKLLKFLENSYQEELMFLNELKSELLLQEKKIAENKKDLKKNCNMLKKLDIRENLIKRGLILE